MRSKQLTDIDVRDNLRVYLTGDGKKDSGTNPDGRYASFDYCFNYFQSFREQGHIGEIVAPANMQQSCLQLGFYLASWGMLRGSTLLLWRSVRFLGGVVRAIAEGDKRLWDVDVDSYTDENIKLLLGARRAIWRALGGHDSVTDTLVTKIMLGVYGNIPAYDTYFRRGLGTTGVSEKSLKKVAEFYRLHKEVIDEFAGTVCTFDFHTGEKTRRHYTKAKIVDMALFMEGNLG
jgi:hypothetical protein